MWFADKANAIYSVWLLTAIQMLQVTAVMLESVKNVHFNLHKKIGMPFSQQIMICSYMRIMAHLCTAGLGCHSLLLHCH